MITKEEFDAAVTRTGQIEILQQDSGSLLVSQDRELSAEKAKLWELRWAYEAQQKRTHGEILTKLANERVFSVEVQGDKVEFVEMCDEAFGTTLTKSELQQLITELQAIADKLHE